MNTKMQPVDVAVIGGGYYGAFVANEIHRFRPDLGVTILEREDELFTRASSTNQGQFHMGYMYSADKDLAEECVENIERFESDFGEAIDYSTESHYGIHQDSQIDPDQYEKFCDSLAIPLERTKRQDLFGPSIEQAYISAEKTFNSYDMQRILLGKLSTSGITVELGFNAVEISETSDGLRVSDKQRQIDASHIINATFADINSLHINSGLPRIPVQYDSFLHFVIDLPDSYRSVGATVIRGAFASLMPSKYRGGHILASGKYRRIDSSTTDKPLENIGEEEIHELYLQASADAVEYMPVLAKAHYRSYTLGTRAAYLTPDGKYTSKASVFKNHGNLENYHAILGGKVSCMYDVSAPLRDIFHNES